MARSCDFPRPKVTWSAGGNSDAGASRIRPAWWLAPVALLALAAACSGERPYLVEGQATTTSATSVTTTTVAPVAEEPLPAREDCQTVSGPGPLQVVIESTASSNPCVALAAHHRMEFVNSSQAPVEIGLGSAAIALQADETSLTEPVGTLLPVGYTGVASASAPIIGLWLVGPDEDTMAGQQMGLNSFGAITIGQTPAEVSAGLGGAPISVADEACYVTRIEQDPYSPLLTIRDGSVAMIEVFSPDQPTRSSVAVGSAEADVAAAYGDQLEEQPPPDGNPNRKLLVFVPADEADQQHRLVFEIEGGQVISMRNGLTDTTVSNPTCT